MINGYSVRLDWSNEDEAYVATSPEFPGLSGVDADANVALAELREALEMAIDLFQEDGQELPEPRGLVAHSGKFVLRLPKSLHAELTRRAHEDDVSLNFYVATLISRGLGDAEARASAAHELTALLRDVRAEVAAGFKVSALGGAANASRVPPIPFSFDLPFSGATQNRAD